MKTKLFFLFGTIALALVMAVGAVLAFHPKGQPVKPKITSLYLVQKNPTDWSIVHRGGWGKLMFHSSGPTFKFVFEGHKLKPNTGYSLIYYADPWPGNNPGALIASGAANNGGNILLKGSSELNTDIPNAADANYPAGGKIWLVLSSDYNNGNSSTGPMTAWNPNSYLFEYNLANYDDTDL